MSAQFPVVTCGAAAVADRGDHMTEEYRTLCYQLHLQDTRQESQVPANPIQIQSDSPIHVEDVDSQDFVNNC